MSHPVFIQYVLDVSQKIFEKEVSRDLSGVGHVIKGEEVNYDCIQEGDFIETNQVT